MPCLGKKRGKVCLIFFIRLAAPWLAISFFEDFIDLIIDKELVLDRSFELIEMNGLVFILLDAI